jgi:hypothetical protein
VRARVVALRDGRRLAWVVGVLGGLDALYVLGTLRLHELPALFGSRYWTVTFVLAAWLVAPLLSFRPRPKGVELRVVAGELRAGRVSLPLHGLVGRVAKVRRGVSVALVSGAQGVFLEMDREVDARRLLERLGLPADLARSSRPAMPLPVPGLVRARRASAAAGLVAAVLYGVLVGTLDQGFMKPYLAIPALVLGGLACALFVAEPHVRRWRRVGEAKAVPAGSARVEAHFRAHEADASRDEAREMGDADAGADALPPRLEALARGDEPASTWLRRVDRLGEGADAYRGASYTAEELAALTSDSNADVSARVGAARLLRTRHGRSETEVVAMTGPALEPRVRVAVLSPEAAARELEQAEPLFAFEDASAEPSERRRG